MNLVDNELEQEQVVTFAPDHKQHSRETKSSSKRPNSIGLLHQVLMIDKYQVRHLNMSLRLTYVQH
jgi:hypothetical protein